MYNYIYVHKPPLCWCWCVWEEAIMHPTYTCNIYIYIYMYTEAATPLVLVCIGGGHYAPKHGDLVRSRGAHVFLGHILPSYTLDLRYTKYVQKNLYMSKQNNRNAERRIRVSRAHWSFLHPGPQVHQILQNKTRRCAKRPVRVSRTHPLWCVICCVIHSGLQVHPI